jgi:LacI family transcriptional regulator
MDSPSPVAPKPRRPDAVLTVKDVAAVAKVSPMTVSRVLSGGLNVRPALREHVEKVIDELGYHRNENARSLRPGQRSGLIGVTITNIGNPYYAGMLRGIEEVASAHNRRILVGNTNENAELEKQLVSDFLGRKVEGLIIVPAGRDARDFSASRLGNVPFVLASRIVPGLDVDAVLVDDIHGAFDATARMLSEGHTRIAFLGNRVSVSTGQRRYEGFRLAHERVGLAPIEELVRLGQQDVTSAEQALTELLDLEAPPTAVFSANNQNTLGAIRAIVKSRRRRSEPSIGTADAPMIRLFGFDSFEFADMSPVPLSVVDHDARELGRIAAEMLFDQFNSEGEAVTSRLVELPVRLLDMY